MVTRALVWVLAIALTGAPNLALAQPVVTEPKIQYGTGPTKTLKRAKIQPPLSGACDSEGVCTVTAPSPIPGPSGPQGPTGLTGSPGIPGSPGAIGSPGPVGSPGAAGSPGIAGSPGVAGSPGAIGSPGLMGSPGMPAPTPDFDCHGPTEKVVWNASTGRWECGTDLQGAGTPDPTPTHTGPTATPTPTATATAETQSCPLGNGEGGVLTITDRAGRNTAVGCKPTVTATATPGPTATPTATVTATATRTATPTVTVTATPTPTATQTAQAACSCPVGSDGSGGMSGIDNGYACSCKPTTTATATPGPTATPTPTATATATVTATPTPTATATPILSGDVDGALDANDLDEAAVRDELEAVLRLQQMQGAVTDAQVPDGVTIDGGDSGAGTTREAAKSITKLSTHDTDCTSRTDGKQGEVCIDEDDFRVWVCVPTAGDCSGGEWKATGDVTAVGTCAGGACTPVLGTDTSGQYVSDVTGSGITVCTPTGTSPRTVSCVSTEADPKVGAVTSGKFCVGSGTQVVCSTTANAGTDITADLEEETHATEHSLGGTDPITVTNLASGCTNAEVLGGTSGGTGVECQADDDVPEVGDFGALGLTGDVSSSGSTTSYSGTVPIAKGGTGATTADTAYTALARVSFTNDTGTGTLTNGLAKLTGAPSKVVRSGTSDVGGSIGICVSGCGTSGSSLIQTAGQASCVFENATVAGDYVGIGTGTAGNCRDVGATFPVTGQVIGRVTETAAAGTRTLMLWGVDLDAVFSRLGPTVEPSELAQPFTMTAGNTLDGNSGASAALWQIPRKTDCSAVSSEGGLCWDTDDDVLYVGSASVALAALMNPTTASDSALFSIARASTDKYRITANNAGGSRQSAIDLNGGSTPFFAVLNNTGFGLLFDLYVANNVAGLFTGGNLPTLSFGLRGNTARTIGLERNDASNTAGVTGTFTAGGATSGATDKAGGTVIVKPGISTGTGEAYAEIGDYTRATSTGTGDNTQIGRAIFGGGKALTNNSATALVNFTLASNTSVGTVVRYSVEVIDGSNHVQNETGVVACNVINSNGTFLQGGTNGCVTQATPMKISTVTASGGSTLTVTWTMTAANPAVLTVNANSGLTPSTGYPRITYSFDNLTNQAVAVQ